MNNQKPTGPFTLSRKEESGLKRTSPGAERDAYLERILFKNRLSVFLNRSCSPELLRPYICPVSRARHDDATYVDKLVDVVMKKVKGEPATYELAVGKEIPHDVLKTTASLFNQTPSLSASASVRTVPSSGNLFLVFR